MATFEPPPTYAEVVLFDEEGKKPRFNPIWLKWFVDIAAFLSASGGSSGGVSHNLTTGLQGGSPGQYYHLTSTQATDLTAGFTGTGNLVRATSPTLVTPTLGVATATTVTSAYKSSDTSAGIGASVTTAGLVGKTMTFKDGILTGFA